MPKDKAARDAAKREYKAAHQKLEENAERERKARIRHETDEYLRLNDRATKAAQNPNLPWWMR
jgi:lysozyme family protein